MKILVLSNTPWNVNNSFGNSYSNIFQGMDDIEFANIYCRSGEPNNKLNIRYFQIDTSSMVKSIFKRNYKTGKVVKKNTNSARELDSISSSIFEYSRKHRWVILLWIRELIWRLGKWKTQELLSFIDDFKPDLIFQPIYGQGYSYLGKIALFIKKYTDVNMVGYVSDDCYTLRQLSFSPLYWVDRLARRPKLKKLMKSCKLMYVISEIQKNEYEDMLKIPCKILTKGEKFENQPDYYEVHTPIHMVFAGNIGEGRWKSLKIIGEVLEEINIGGIKIDLTVYTATPMTNEMLKELSCQSIRLCPPVPSIDLPGIYQQADVLVHVESTDLKERLLVHQSFSTKLVDYFCASRAIFAYGPLDAASIDVLKSRDAALVADTKDECMKILKNIVSNPQILINYSNNGWAVGRKYHKIDTIQLMLREDFKRITKEGV